MTTVAATSQSMGRQRKQKGDGASSTDTTPDGTEMVRVNTDLARMIAMIVAWRRRPTAQLLDPILRQEIVRQFAEVTAEMNRASKVSRSPE